MPIKDDNRHYAILPIHAAKDFKGVKGVYSQIDVNRPYGSVMFIDDDGLPVYETEQVQVIEYDKREKGKVAKELPSSAIKDRLPEQARNGLKHSQSPLFKQQS